MNFDLPTTGTEPRPAVTSASTCKDWLATVPLVNSVQAQAAIMRQLTLLHRFTLPPKERFKILETLLGPLTEVQADASKKFAGRALPLAPPEQAALDSTLGVWREFALGYLRCFDEICTDHTSMSDLQAQRKACAASPDLAKQAATMAQRLISVFADWQVDLCRGAQLPDPDYWRKLHQILLAVETLGVAGHEVHDAVRHGKGSTSALAAYAECNLISAANSYEFPARHMAWIARWARRWGAKLALLHAPPEDIRSRAVPLLVDLESGNPASYAPQTAANNRWLETTELKKSLLARIAYLDKGKAPADLQLGNDVTQPAAGQLLQHLVQRWCQGGAPRRHERHPTVADCSFIGGFEPIHFHLSGHQTFRAPTRSDAALRREREEFETFGDRSHRTENLAPGGEATQFETWRLLDESAAGMRITRPLKDGVRIGVGMVIAIKTTDSPRFMLGRVRWALREGDNALSAGVQLFPGETRHAAVRALEADGPAGAWRQGFMLPEVPVLKEPATVVLPPGMFRLDRNIEVMVDEKTKILKLSHVLDRGIEFERCDFHD